MVRQSGHRRDGFTLIELLVVISIIAILMGLTTAAVMRVKEAGTRTENGWRIDQVTIANDTFCSTSSLGPPNYLPPAPFRLRKQYAGTEMVEIIYLKKLFPNLPYLVGPAVPGDSRYHPNGTGLTDIDLVDGNQVMVFFLTGGEVTQYTGFSNNSQQPFVAGVAGETRKGPYLQLKPSMYSKSPPGVTANGQAWLIDPYGSPYAVFTSGPSGKYLNSTGTVTAPATFALQSFTFGSVTIFPYSRGGDPTKPPSSTNTVKYENPKTLQIISAGQDKAFGPGGDWSAGAQGAGRDDKSNFSTATLGSGPQ